VIPVRVAAATTAHIVRDDFVLTDPAHPLFHEYCPVCDGQLGLERIALVYVGTAPDSRSEGKRFWTGAAVAVHQPCAPPPSVAAPGT
jgi:hypothetical protein